MREIVVGHPVDEQDVYDLYGSDEGEGAAVEPWRDVLHSAGQPTHVPMPEPFAPSLPTSSTPPPATTAVGAGSAVGTEVLALIRAQHVQSLGQLQAAHERELVARDAHARSLLVAYNDAVQARDGQSAVLQGQLAEVRASNATLLALVQDRETIIRLREQEVESLQARIEGLEEQLHRAGHGIAALGAENAYLRDLLYGPVEPRRRPRALICEPEQDETVRRRR